MALVCASCQNYLLGELDSRIELDASNTYRVGEPIRFNIRGNCDGLTFYSGENGHQYQYRNRAEVAYEDITSLTFDIRIQPRFGEAGAMDIYMSKDWKYNFKGNDAEYDRALVRQMYEAGMPGWEKIDWAEGKTSVWADYHFDIAKYAQNFALAFHWHPTSKEKTISQRTYWMNGFINIGLKGVAPTQKTLRDLETFTLSMPDAVTDAYKKNSGNGSVVYTSAAAQYNFQGVSATALDYDIDTWVFTRPISLNGVQPDACEVLKNFTTTVKSFDYIYETPGTYEATFVAFNETVQGRRESIKKIKITITY